MSAVGNAGSGALQGGTMGAALGPWGALAGGIAGGVAGFALGGAADRAKRRAAKEALRRFDLASTQQLAEGGAAEAASGAEYGGSSMSLYLAEMSKEFRRQHASAASDADRALKLGNLANTFGLASTVGSSLFRFGQANNWWQNKPSVT